MSRNFALLRIVGKEQEYVQTASETPELLDVPVHPLVPKTFPPDSTHQRLPEQQVAGSWRRIDRAGKMTEGIVLVLQIHSTRKERTRSRVWDLTSAGVRILGAVLNQPAG